MKRLSTTREIMNKFLPYIEGRVLDLGAGSAKYKELIASKTESYLACDAVKNENIDDVCDVLNLHYPEESFDTVISTQVMEHVKNPLLMASQINKVLKTGGKVILTAPLLIPMHSDPDDYFRFTKNGLVEIFKQSGFAIIESGYYGGFPIVISEMIHFSWFNPYERQSVWADRMMRLIERIAIFFDKIFPGEIIFSNSYIVAQKIKK